MNKCLVQGFGAGNWIRAYSEVRLALEPTLLAVMFYSFVTKPAVIGAIVDVIVRVLWCYVRGRDEIESDFV